MIDNKKYRDCPHCGAAMMPLPPKGKVMCSWYGCPGAPPTYREKQHRKYTLAMAQGNQGSAQDALWRAASEADMLTPQEHSYTELSPARVNALLSRLGWS